MLSRPQALGRATIPRHLPYDYSSLVGPARFGLYRRHFISGSCVAFCPREFWSGVDLLRQQGECHGKSYADRLDFEG